MTSWISQAVLANVTLSAAIEAYPAAFAPTDDARVDSVSAAHPVHAAFLARFTDAFGRRVHPSVLIVESSAVVGYGGVEAMASIRDILSICVVARARARHIQNKGGNRVFYSRSFDFYPWMVSRDNESLVASTPALAGFHDVGCFAGQTASEVHLAEVSPGDLDRPLFDALLNRWQHAYGGQEASSEDTKLMRSLNMAFHASQAPADQGAMVFDYGRILALWVSALEILVHPGKGSRINKRKVLEHLANVIWFAENCGNKAQEICRAIYKWRNHFLHGNPIDVDAVQPLMSRDSLFGVAAPLYRMALASFLRLRREEALSLLDDPENLGREVAARMKFSHYQSDFETVILQCRPG